MINYFRHSSSDKGLENTGRPIDTNLIELYPNIYVALVEVDGDL
jgi:hypothetical protein